MKKVFPIQLDLDLHRRMKHASFDAGESLHQWVLKAIEARLGAGDGRSNHRTNPKNDRNRTTAKSQKN